MARFTYLIPRLIIVLLVMLALWMGTDPLARGLVINQAQQAIGAKVEIGQLRCSLENEKLFLQDLSIANPNNPNLNLLQADMAYVDIDRDALLRKQAIIKTSQTSGVMFGVRRTNFGGLPGHAQPRASADTLGEPALGELAGQSIVDQWQPQPLTPLDRLGLQWLDQLPAGRGPAISEEEFETPSLAQTLEQSWAAELSALSGSVREIVQATEALSAPAEQEQRVNPLNPLRTPETLHVNTFAKLSQLEKESQALAQRIQKVEADAIAARATLTEARNRDIAKIKQSTQATTFASDAISKLLLTRLEEEYVAEVIGLFHQFRMSLPDPQNDFQTESARGLDVYPAGYQRGTPFLLKQIELEGEGRFANEFIQFAGTARDIASHPQLHEKPVTFELRAQGDHHFVIACELDRRTKTPIDKLRVACPSLPLPERLLGEPNSMLVTMGPESQLQAEVRLEARGEQLTGDLVFRHSNVALHVDQLHNLAGGENTALRINQALAKVNQFETRVSLGGTIEAYQFDFQSDLGNRFANSINSMLANQAAQDVATRQATVDARFNAALATLNQRLLPELTRLQATLDRGVQTAQQPPEPPNQQSRLPRIR